MLPRSLAELKGECETTKVSQRVGGRHLGELTLVNEGRILGSVRHTKKRFSANKKCGHGNGRGGVCSAHEAIPLHFTVVPHVGAFGQSQAADGRQ